MYCILDRHKHKWSIHNITQDSTSTPQHSCSISIYTIDNMLKKFISHNPKRRRFDTSMNSKRYTHRHNDTYRHSRLTWLASAISDIVLHEVHCTCQIVCCYFTDYFTITCIFLIFVDTTIFFVRQISKFFDSVLHAWLTFLWISLWCLIFFILFSA